QRYPLSCCALHGIP
ncbi:hypothetical protein CP061683_1000B, partial [Chlamydia psittaci 06-1683]